MHPYIVPPETYPTCWYHTVLSSGSSPSSSSSPSEFPEIACTLILFRPKNTPPIHLRDNSLEPGHSCETCVVWSPPEAGSPHRGPYATGVHIGLLGLLQDACLSATHSYCHGIKFLTSSNGCKQHQEKCTVYNAKAGMNHLAKPLTCSKP